MFQSKRRSQGESSSTFLAKCRHWTRFTLIAACLLVIYHSLVVSRFYQHQQHSHEGHAAHAHGVDAGDGDAASSSKRSVAPPQLLLPNAQPAQSPTGLPPQQPQQPPQQEPGAAVQQPPQPQPQPPLPSMVAAAAAPPAAAAAAGSAPAVKGRETPAYAIDAKAERFIYESTASKLCSGQEPFLFWDWGMGANIGTSFALMSLGLSYATRKQIPILVRAHDENAWERYFLPLSNCDPSEQERLSASPHAIKFSSIIGEVNQQRTRQVLAEPKCDSAMWFPGMAQAGCSDKLLRCDFGACGPAGSESLRLASRQLLHWRSAFVGYLFQPSAAIMTTLAPALDQSEVLKYSRRHGGPGIVAIQIRRGDKINDEDTYLPLSAYMAAAEQFHLKHGASAVYIASDDMVGIKKELAELKHNLTVVLSPFANTGFSLRRDQSKDHELIMAAIQDVWVLSECDFLVTKLTSYFSKTILAVGIAKGNYVDWSSVDGNTMMIGGISVPMHQWNNFIPY